MNPGLFYAGLFWLTGGVVSLVSYFRSPDHWRSHFEWYPAFLPSPDFYIRLSPILASLGVLAGAVLLVVGLAT